MENYKELIVWQKSVELVVDVYKKAKSFPKEEIYSLTDQIKRAATSIPANIAEGWGRGNPKEFIHFLKIARGSLMELENHLIVSQKLNYLTEENFNDLSKKIDEIGKMIYKFSKSVEKKIPSKNLVKQ